MPTERPPHADELAAGELFISVPSTKGALAIAFRPDGVLIRLPYSRNTALVSWSDWEHIAELMERHRS